MSKFPTELEFKNYFNSLTEQDNVLRKLPEFRKIYESHLDGGESSEFYPYIPVYEVLGLHKLFFLCKLQNLSLFDVGAGTGKIIMLAKFCGIPAAGLERQCVYVEAGRKVYGLSEEELMLEDAFEISPEILSKFGVIYTYMPIRNSKRMTELHFSLYSKVPKGTFFAEMLPEYYPLFEMANYRTWFEGEEFTRLKFRFIRKVYNG